MDQNIVPNYKTSDHQIKLTIYQTICILHVPYLIYYGAIALSMRVFKIMNDYASHETGKYNNE